MRDPARPARRRGVVLLAGALIGVMGLAEARPGVCYLDPGGAFDRATDDGQVRDAIHRYNAAVLAMDADAIAGWYLPTGEMWNGDTLARRGPEAIRTFLKSFDGQVRVESQELTIDRVTWQDDRAVVETHYQQRARVVATQALVTAEGRLRFEWARDEGGTWRIARATTVPDPARAP